MRRFRTEFNKNAINDLETIGKSIRTVRKRKMISQKELAELSGVSAGYLSSLENGSTNETILLMLQVFHAVGIKMTLTADIPKRNTQ